jgi:glucan phosphoethanolaminetransferase (alkaline phosphatase superfamily)
LGWIVIMLLLAIIVALVAVLGWVIVELNGRLVVRICAAVVVFVCFSYVGYVGGQLREAIRWAWVPKEHSFLAGGLSRMEQLAASGDTNAVKRALAAYNRTVRASTNEFGYYQAALALYEESGAKK